MPKSILFAMIFMASIKVVAAQDAIPNNLPSAEQALSAFATFASDPVNRLDATQPFLDFIRGSGEVHIVLNDALLGWMYETFDERNKAVLYAAFLGGNMAGQINSGKSASDDIAGMTSALRAYQALKREQPDFTLKLFEQLTSAEQDGTLDAQIAQIINGTAAR